MRAPKPACPHLHGSQCPKPFCTHRLQCCSLHQLLEDCKRRGLWSWMFPWPHLLGAWAGQDTGPGWTHFPTVAESNQGLYCGTSGNGDRERAVPGLLLGCTWGRQCCVLATACCLSPRTHGHQTHSQVPVLQHPARVEVRGVGEALPSPWSELLPAAGVLAAVKCPFPATSIWACVQPLPQCVAMSLALGAYPALGSSAVLWHVCGPAGALKSPEEHEGRALPPAHGKQTVATQGPSKGPAGSGHPTAVASM